jgi:hypothetical protein
MGRRRCEDCGQIFLDLPPYVKHGRACTDSTAERWYKEGSIRRAAVAGHPLAMIEYAKELTPAMAQVFLVTAALGGAKYAGISEPKELCDSAEQEWFMHPFN